MPCSAPELPPMISTHPAPWTVTLNSLCRPLYCSYGPLQAYSFLERKREAAAASCEGSAAGAFCEDLDHLNDMAHQLLSTGSVSEPPGCLPAGRAACDVWYRAAPAVYCQLLGVWLSLRPAIPCLACLTCLCGYLACFACLSVVPAGGQPGGHLLHPGPRGGAQGSPRCQAAGCP